MKTYKEILETKKHAMNATIRRKIGVELRKVLKPTYFKEIPLQDIFDILDKFNIVPLQEDGTYWSGMLIGGTKKTEQVYFDLGVKSEIDKNKRYPKINNASLALSYFVMSSGKYEVIGYIA